MLSMETKDVINVNDNIIIAKLLFFLEYHGLSKPEYGIVLPYLSHEERLKDVNESFFNHIVNEFQKETTMKALKNLEDFIQDPDRFNFIFEEIKKKTVNEILNNI